MVIFEPPLQPSIVSECSWRFVTVKIVTVIGPELLLCARERGRSVRVFMLVKLRYSREVREAIASA